MRLYRIDIFDCYIKDEYRKHITAIQQSKSWYSFLSPEIWEYADKIDHKTAPYFPDNSIAWDENTGRFRLCVEFNIKTYPGYSTTLEFLLKFLPMLCEDQKPLYYASCQETSDNHQFSNTVITDLKSNRTAQLDFALHDLCEDFSEYESFFDSQETAMPAEKDIPECYYISRYGTLSSVRQILKTNKVFESLGFDDFVKYAADSGGKIIFDLIDENGRLEIPNNVNRIEEYTFKGSKKLRSLISMKHLGIGAGAFEYCVNLECVELSDYTYIGHRAFSCCTSLKEIVIPKLTGSTENYSPYISGCIEPYTFFGCTSLEKVTFLSDLDMIQIRAFAMCESLKALELPLTRIINRGAFLGCKSLKSVELPDGLFILSSDAFNYCTGLTEITIPESVKSIGSTINNDIDRALGGIVFNKAIRYHKQDGEPVELIDNITIKGKNRSCAHMYALYNGINFEET